MKWHQVVLNPHLAHLRFLPIFLLLFTLAVPLSGCSASSTQADRSQNTAKLPMASTNIGPDELERLNRAFADHYVMRLATACNLILENNPDDAQCRRIRDLRATGAMSVYDIVTDSDPYLQTLNLAVVVNLQAIAWVDEGNAQKEFGDRGLPLADSIATSRAEVRQITARLFSPSQLETLDSIILEWRRKNPSLTLLVNTRFTDFISSRAIESHTQAAAAGLFAELEQARQTVDDVRALAERALYLSKRMPLLLSWRSESALDALLDNPHLVQGLSDFHLFAGAADKLPATLDQARKNFTQDLDSQRKALLADFDQRQPAVDATVKGVRETFAQADALTTNARSLLPELQKTMLALQDLMKQSDTLASRYLPQAAPQPAPAPSPVVPNATLQTPVPPTTAAAAMTRAAASGPQPRPFDIQDYTAALKEASHAAGELNAVLTNSQTLLDSPNWQERITEVNAAADGRVRLAAEQSYELVQSVNQRIYVALAALLLVLVLARILSAWLLQKMRLRNDRP